MEAGSESDAAKRRQAKHQGCSGLGLQRGKAFDRKYRNAPNHRKRRYAAIHWQCGRAAFDGERWHTALDGNCRIASIGRQRRRAALAVTISQPKFIWQPPVLGNERIQSEQQREQRLVVQ